MIKQEFDSSGIPSLNPYLNDLLDNGAAKHVKVKWSKSERYVIIIDGKKYQYKGEDAVDQKLRKAKCFIIYKYVIKYSK